MKQAKALFKKLKGNMWQFPVGVKNDLIQVNLCVDDGTWGDHLILKFNDIPYCVIPIVNRGGLRKVIMALKDIYKNYPTGKNGS